MATILSLCLPLGGASESASSKAVLALYSLDRDSPLDLIFDQSFQKALSSDASAPIEYYSEFMDSFRFSGDSYSQLLLDYLRQKYAERNIDVVVVNGVPALHFLLKHRDALFPATPLVFLLTDLPELTSRNVPPPGVTGVVIGHHQQETLEMALRLHPATRNVFVVLQTEERDKTEARVQDQLKPFRDKVAINYLTNLPTAVLIDELKRVPAQSIVLYVRQTGDAKGRPLASRETLALIAPSVRVPIYGSLDTYIGYGIVGGYVFNTEGVGKELADMALRVASGVSPENIPVHTAKTVPMFDCHQLHLWGIDEKRLPPGSIIRFRVPTFWERYKWHFAGMFSLCLVEAGLIAWLLLERQRRQHAREAFRVSEENYRAFFELTAVGAGQASPEDGRFLRVNEAHCKLTGYSREELLQMHFFDITHPEDRPKDIDKFRRLVSGEITQYSNEKRYIRKDGQIVWVHVHLSMVRDEAGKPLHTVAIVQDITERKQVQEALRQSQERYQLATSAGRVAVFDWNLQTGEIYVDPWLKTSLGYEDPEIPNHLDGWEPLIHPEDFQLIRQRLRDYLDGRRPFYQNESRRFHKDGSIRWFDSRGEAIRDARGQAIRIIGTVVDITEQKQAREELEQLSLRFLGLQDEERSRIARELHDVTAQNLFAATLGLARAEGRLLPAELKETLAECQTLCEQSLKEVRTLSYLLHPPMLDQVGLIAALQWYIDGFTKRSGIEVGLLASEEIGRLSQEIERDLFRVVQEALTNVHRHSGSPVAIVRLEKQGHQLVIQVKDEGRGIYQKSDEVAASGIELLGVGIRGMQERLRQLNGRLEIESSNHGTTVTAAVPLPGQPALRLRAGRGSRG
jgi:PAS domain S-box-containing protein